MGVDIDTQVRPVRFITTFYKRHLENNNNNVL